MRRALGGIGDSLARPIQTLEADPRRAQHHRLFPPAANRGTRMQTQHCIIQISLSCLSSRKPWFCQPRVSAIQQGRTAKLTDMRLQRYRDDDAVYAHLSRPQTYHVIQDFHCTFCKTILSQCSTRRQTPGASSEQCDYAGIRRRASCKSQLSGPRFLENAKTLMSQM